MLKMEWKLNEEKYKEREMVTFLFPLLVLFVCLVLDGTEEGEDDSGLRVDAHGRHQDFATAFHNVSAGKNHLEKIENKLTKILEH
jgi:hypothetical protein